MIRLFFFVSTLILAASYSTVPIVQSNVPPDTVITLERTICYGACPMYTLTVKADGSVSFQPKYVEGRAIVSGELKRTSISRDKVKELVLQFAKADYFAFKDRYEFGDKECAESWTDYPSAITSITINGKSKSVNHYYGCMGNIVLDRLTELESKIDEIANTKQWLN
jgi:hypothetical protein